MKLYQFNEWKVEALAYWNNAVSSTPNGVTNTPASGFNNQFSNKDSILTIVSDTVSSMEKDYNLYKISPVVLDKTKDALLSCMSYVSMKDIVTVKGGPQIPTILTSMKDWYAVYNTDLPDYTTLFTITKEITTIAGSGGGYNSNQDLINANVWYNTPPHYPESPITTPEGSGAVDVPLELVTAVGIIFTTEPLSAFSAPITNAITNDVNNINNFQASVLANTKDSIIYRMFGEPETVVSNKKAKQIILENYKFSEVLVTFNWKIEGLN